MSEDNKFSRLKAQIELWKAEAAKNSFLIQDAESIEPAFQAAADAQDTEKAFEQYIKLIGHIGLDQESGDKDNLTTEAILRELRLDTDLHAEQNIYRNMFRHVFEGAVHGLAGRGTTTEQLQSYVELANGSDILSDAERSDIETSLARWKPLLNEISTFNKFTNLAILKTPSLLKESQDVKRLLEQKTRELNASILAFRF